MKIAVSAVGEDLDAAVDPRFGRCRYFLLVDEATMRFEAVPNEAAMSGGGAGIQAAQIVADKGADVVLTGNVGPNAFRTLSAAGIKVITGVSGSVRSALERYKRGELRGADRPNVEGHYGIGRGMGRGR